MRILLNLRQAPLYVSRLWQSTCHTCILHPELLHMSANGAESSKSPMDQTMLQVEDNMVVSLSYILTTSSGPAGQSKEKQIAKQFVQGRKQMVPGLEQALYG